MSDFAKFCAVFVFVVGIILTAGFSVKIGQKIGQKRGYDQGYADAIASIKPDTVWRDTTIYEEKPVPVIEYRDTGRLVYVKIPVKDTTGHADTNIVPMPTTVKQYADTVDHSYELQISGVEPQLDWIKVHQKTAYITVPVPEYKYPTFILSPAIDAFVFPDLYGVGAGIDLDFWVGRWEFSGGGGYSVQTNPQETVTGPYGTFKVRYNLIRK